MQNGQFKARNKENALKKLALVTSVIFYFLFVNERIGISQIFSFIH